MVLEKSIEDSIREMGGMGARLHIYLCCKLFTVATGNLVELIDLNICPQHANNSHD